MNYKSLFLFISCLLNSAAKTEVNGEHPPVNLRAGQIQRILQPSCVAPGGSIPCRDDNQIDCSPCCWYDPNDLSVYMSEDELAKEKKRLAQGCNKIMGTTSKCFCGPRSARVDKTSPQPSPTSPNSPL